MGKKNKPQSNLGRALIKERFHANSGQRRTSDKSMLHTTEIQDGYDWGRLNLQSVTEESSFQEFLSTAELAGTEFQAEKLNIKFVNPKANVGLLSHEEKVKYKLEQNKNKSLLTIPRRPKWNENTTVEELHNTEKENFLDWRRQLAILQEKEGILMTPYEKNLEFWRQLWRVVERSDVVVQIVDARNPLLFRCEDLEKYVKEVSPNKMNMILINKADLLTEKQRVIWAEYFAKQNVRVAFFSALIAETNDEKEEKLVDVKKQIQDLDEAVNKTEEQLRDLLDNLKVIENVSNDEETTNDNLEKVQIDEKENAAINDSFNSPEVLTQEKLVSLFKTIHTGIKVQENLTTIGLVGYPNVGKSSTINSLLTEKKVSVSATPGKTKHFQTLFLDPNLMLCDCPGLVMPSFLYTKAEMILNGILPIDQMKDHVPPVNLVTTLIPRHVFEDKYGIMLPKNEDLGSDQLSADELLNAYGYNRGFMTANGQPDNPRAARYILKDFVNGKLLFANAPPGIDQKEFHPFPEPKKSSNRTFTPREARAVRPDRMTSEDIDKIFFKNRLGGAHIQGPTKNKVHLQNSDAKSTDSVNGSIGVISKPWKIINKHENKKKREKLRRVYAHLDQH